MSQIPISCEFFPPRDAEGRTRLIDKVAKRLVELKPEHCSVTYGAGGSTREGTAQTVEELIAAGIESTPHLSIGTDDEAQVRKTLDHYADLGVKRIVALRGDQPSGLGGRSFSNNAESLVRLIRQHSGDRFHVIVAAYPEVHPDSKDRDADLDFFRRKVDAGADTAITQYFYNVDAYARFLDRCAAANIEIPIVPGIMPITNYASLVRFSDNCGAEIPRWLRLELGAFEDGDPALIDFGVEFVSQFCERLIALGAPGLHFYTLNRWGATQRICRNLGLA